MAYHLADVSAQAPPDLLDPRWPSTRAIAAPVREALPHLAEYARLHELAQSLKPDELPDEDAGSELE